MYKALCEAWRQEREPQRALPWCELAAHSREDGWAQVRLADVQLDLSEYAAAEETLQWALAVGQPGSSVSAYQKLGEVYLRLERASEAIAAFSSALAHGGSNQWLQAGLAQALLKAGDVEAACESLSQAQDLGYRPAGQLQALFAACEVQAEGSEQ
jgi:predicted Zn-dependent protease